MRINNCAAMMVRYFTTNSRPLRYQILTGNKHMALSVQPTQRIYYQDTYVGEISAEIIETGVDPKGDFVIFNRTLFHPQGGGQPNDQGFFEIDGKRIPVTQLVIDDEVIKHYYTPQECVALAVSQTVKLSIDMEKRALFARLHSAGHLIANAVKELYPQLNGCKGNHFPGGQAAVGCELAVGEILPDLAEIKTRLIEKIRELVGRAIPLINSWESSPRTVQFVGYPAYPCGGTHVRDSSEIGVVTIRNVRKEKEGGCKIGYDIA